MDSKQITFFWIVILISVLNLTVTTFSDRSSLKNHNNKQQKEKEKEITPSRRQTNENLCKELIRTYDTIPKDRQTLQTLIHQLKTQYNQTKLSCAIYLEPIYLWAQNMTHLFVKFQFINSGKTSACTHVLYKNPKLQHSFIGVDLACIQGDHLLIYTAKIQTFMPLNYYHGKWEDRGQNSMVLECMKSPSPYFWKRLKLHRNQGINERKQNRNYIWWEIMRLYVDDLKDYLGDLEVQESQQVSWSFGQGKRRGRNGKNKKRYRDRQYYLKNKRNDQSMQQSGSMGRRGFYCGGDSPYQLGSWLQE